MEFVTRFWYIQHNEQIKLTEEISVLSSSTKKNPIVELEPGSVNSEAVELHGGLPD